MRDYRLYCLDETGRIGFAEWIEAADDADAIRQAHLLNERALKCEIWQGQRLVATIGQQALSA